jgi:hypothetical protein
MIVKLTNRKKREEKRSVIVLIANNENKSGPKANKEKMR